MDKLALFLCSTAAASRNSLHEKDRDRRSNSTSPDSVGGAHDPFQTGGGLAFNHPHLSLRNNHQVRFDSGVLLDWLISPETNFLQYLTMVLRLALAEWSEFATRVSCAKDVALENEGDASVPAGRIEDEEGKEEEELILSEEEAGRLGQAVSCLSGLVASARGLEKNGLAPYNLAPLLRRIDQVVSLYEDCGDADEGENSD